MWGHMKYLKKYVWFLLLSICGVLFLNFTRINQFQGKDFQKTAFWISTKHNSIFDSLTVDFVTKNSYDVRVINANVTDEFHKKYDYGAVISRFKRASPNQYNLGYTWPRIGGQNATKIGFYTLGKRNFYDYLSTNRMLVKYNGSYVTRNCNSSGENCNYFGDWSKNNGGTSILEDYLYNRVVDKIDEFNVDGYAFDFSFVNPRHTPPLREKADNNSTWAKNYAKGFLNFIERITENHLIVANGMSHHTNLFSENVFINSQKRLLDRGVNGASVEFFGANETKSGDFHIKSFESSLKQMAAWKEYRNDKFFMVYGRGKNKDM